MARLPEPVYVDTHKSYAVEGLRISGLPGVVITTCSGVPGACGGIRFRCVCVGPCRKRCVQLRNGAIRGQDVVRHGADIVSRCAHCNRYYVRRSRRQLDEPDCCSARTCVQAFYAGEHGRSVVQVLRCESCGEFCPETVQLTSHLLPHLYPGRLFCGSEFRLCPGECTRRMRDSLRESLRRQASDVLLDCAKSDNLDCASMRRELEEWLRLTR
jgi:hypothetical protein